MQKGHNAMTHQLTLEQSLTEFLNALAGKNRSVATTKAYAADIHQFITFLHETNITIACPAHVQRADVTDYLTHLAKRELSGATRARKVAALREYFRYLVEHGVLDKSPLLGMETPKREKHSRTHLTRDEYTKLLSLAGASPRDYAMLQVFLQTGVRVSELCNLRLDDVDLANRNLLITAGKGMRARTIELEKKATAALKSYLAIRPSVLHDYRFVNRYGEPISERGVEKLIIRYAKAAGLSKKVTCHTLRHTFATAKAQQGISAYRLKDWLGHASLETTQIYIHLGKQNALREMEQTSL